MLEAIDQGAPRIVAETTTRGSMSSRRENPPFTRSRAHQTRRRSEQRHQPAEPCERSGHAIGRAPNLPPAAGRNQCRKPDHAPRSGSGVGGETPNGGCHAKAGAISPRRGRKCAARFRTHPIHATGCWYPALLGGTFLEILAGVGGLRRAAATRPPGSPPCRIAVSLQLIGWIARAIPGCPFTLWKPNQGLSASHQSPGDEVPGRGRKARARKIALR